MHYHDLYHIYHYLNKIINHMYIYVPVYSFYVLKKKNDAGKGRYDRRLSSLSMRVHENI